MNNNNFHEHSFHEYKLVGLYPETEYFPEWYIETANSRKMITQPKYERQLSKRSKSKDAEVKMIARLWYGITCLDKQDFETHRYFAKTIGITYETSKPEFSPSSGNKILTAKVTGQTGTYIILHEILYNSTFQIPQPDDLFVIVELHKNAILYSDKPYQPKYATHLQKYFTPEEWVEIMFEKNITA